VERTIYHRLPDRMPHNIRQVLIFKVKKTTKIFKKISVFKKSKTQNIFKKYGIFSVFFRDYNILSILTFKG